VFGRLVVEIRADSVAQGVVIIQGQVADTQLGLPGPKLDRHRAVVNRYGPEGARAVAVAAYGTDLGTEAGVEVVNLRTLRLRRRRVDVESDEGEGTLMNFPVGPLVCAVHEPQVRVPEEGVAVVVHARALDMGNAEEAIEIGDGARLAAE